MKSRTKKILTGIVLGTMVGACGLVSGCSLTEDQTKALNLITEKSDEIIALLEENMELTNSQLSKVDAVELVALARTKLLLNKYENFYMKTTTEAYQGYFEKSMGPAQTNAPLVYYKRTSDMQYAALFDYDGTLVIINKDDFVNNTSYRYNATTEEKQDSTYKSGGFGQTQIDPFTLLDLKTLTIDDIVNIETTADGYKFNILATVYHPSGENHIISTYIAQFEITKNADFKSAHFDIVNKSYADNQVRKDGDNVVLDDKGLPIPLVSLCDNVTTLSYNVEYKYDNIDFSQIDAVIAVIEANN